MKDKITIAKLDSWIMPIAIGIIGSILAFSIIAVAFYCIGYKLGNHTEKIGALEDVVFNHGLYKKIERIQGDK